MPSLLCLDLGTSAAKAALLDLDGAVHGRASCTYSIRTDPGGTAEQDPQDWLHAARVAITDLLRDHPTPGGLLALGLTGQMQDLVLLPETEPTPPAILYSDTRAVQDAEEIHDWLRQEGISWEEVTGNLQDATSCAAMFRRLTRTAPELVGRARAVVFGPAGHLARALGCGNWCDPTTAAATGLLDARTGAWSAPVARAAGLEEEQLPALITATGQVVGLTGTSAQELLGLPPGLPIVLAPGDAGATTLGIIGLEVGDDYAYLGTSGWIADVTPREGAEDGPVGATQSRAAHRLALASGGDHERDLRISALLAAGAAADWARAALLDGASPAVADAQLAAREAREGRGPTGLLALPSILGERYPVRDAELRAAIIGMGPHTRGIDMYAAVLEGVAQALAQAAGASAPAPEAVGEAPSPLAVTGGGAASEPWLRILADVTGRAVRAIDGTDAALVGCAIAAADALGLDHRIHPLASRPGGLTVAPDPSAARAHAALRAPHRALYTAVAEVRALG
ncbi:FGGY family carbohydrate kinase [Brachybacterium sacelli]|uniref:Xylulokinase n=1 Tax=Brachybacterium sacelli TaxID=173364 RepID=A0ABS4X3T8_9MICO|nr:FGGY family carbohydrate kinase [Brachybacterium sacelli]MBP2383102.1 xylulokinase [Brachybacterium sacelli]